LFLGRALKVAFVLLAGLLIYMAVLSLSLRFGPEGLGPRLCQLGLAAALPGAMTYWSLWRNRKRRVPWRLILGLAAGGFLAPSILAVIPILSLCCSVALVAAPYYVPKRLPTLLKGASRSAGLANDGHSLGVRYDFLLLKMHVCYFRWLGGDVNGGRHKLVKCGGQDYLRVRTIGPSDSACRAGALRRAMEVAKLRSGIVVPATIEEVRCLEANSEPGESIAKLANMERSSLTALSVAMKRTLSCASEGAKPNGGYAADVIIRDVGDACSVRILSSRPIPMDRERLNDLLDLYGIVRTE